MFPQTCIQNNQGYRRNFLKMVTLDGKEETDNVAERIAGYIRELEGMDGGEEALKTAGISYVQPNWFADGDWCYLLARLRGYFSSIWKISKGCRPNSVFRDKYTSVFAYICLYGQLNVSSYLNADTCMYIDIWRYICQYAYNSQAIQVCWRIYKYMSIYAYIDIYLSIQP